MRRTVPALSALLLLAGFASAAVAASSGTNLSWGNCGSLGQMQENFACDTNVGASVLYVSVVPMAALPQFNGVATILNLKTDQAALSPWWQLQQDGCRGPTSVDPTVAGLVVDFNFLLESGCADPWGGVAQGGMLFQPAFFGAPNTARIRTVSAISGTTALEAGREYSLCKLVLRHTETIGAGACAGCSDNACILLSTVQLTTPAGVGDQFYGDAAAASRNWVLWRSGVVTGGCPAGLPARNTTWGQLKSLYR